jgi:hypothetical protein
MKDDRDESDLEYGLAAKAHRDDGESERERSKVTGIDEWRRRGQSALAAGLRRPQSRAEDISLLTMPQKQALLIRYILCDDVTSHELDALLGFLVASA